MPVADQIYVGMIGCKSLPAVGGKQLGVQNPCKGYQESFSCILWVKRRKSDERLWAYRSRPDFELIVPEVRLLPLMDCSRTSLPLGVAAASTLLLL